MMVRANLTNDSKSPEPGKSAPGKEVVSNSLMFEDSWIMGGVQEIRHDQTKVLICEQLGSKHQ